MILEQNYRFGQIIIDLVPKLKIEFSHSELVEDINFVYAICNSNFGPKFQIWADLVPSLKYNLGFLKFGIHSRENNSLICYLEIII